MTVSEPELAEATESFDTPNDRGLGIFLAIAGAIGTFASSILTVDKIVLLEAAVKGETKTLECDINPFISCSNILQSDQAQAFGFPNPFIGIIAFSILMTLGVILASGVSLPRWFWAGLQAGTVFGAAFMTWLQYESLYQIGHLCPWCMVVWAVTIPTTVLVTRRFTGWLFLRNWSGLVIALWYLAIIAAIWFRFGADLWA